MEKVSDFWEMFPDIKPIDINKINIDDLAERFQNIYSNGRNNKAVLKNINGFKGKGSRNRRVVGKITSLIFKCVFLAVLLNSIFLDIRQYYILTKCRGVVL